MVAFCKTAWQTCSSTGTRRQKRWEMVHLKVPNVCPSLIVDQTKHQGSLLR